MERSASIGGLGHVEVASRLSKTRMKNSPPGGGKVSDVYEYAESPETTCASGYCLTLQIVVSCCRSVDTLSILLPLWLTVLWRQRPGVNLAATRPRPQGKLGFPVSLSCSGES